MTQSYVEKFEEISSGKNKKIKFFEPIYTSDHAVVMPYKGKKISFKIELKYDDHGIPNGCDFLEFKQVDESTPYTASRQAPLHVEKYEIKWGGSPRFVQSEYYPMAEDGTRYDFICTIENDWGDCGNCNIFILTEPSDSSDTPFTILDIYVEASCD